MPQIRDRTYVGLSPRRTVSHAPRKRFGQHFLKDASILAAIVEAIGAAARRGGGRDRPRTGRADRAAAAAGPHLLAIEIDRDLVARLRRRFPPERLVLHEADVLAFDFRALASDARLRLVGNLPYNISSPLLIRLLDFRDCIEDLHFMLQKEVVQRIAARPGASDYGRLAVMMQAFHEVEHLFDVPPQAFDPPPRVDSAVLRMMPRRAPLARDPKALERVVAVAFGQRRKMIRGTLLPWLRQQGIDPDDPEAGLVPTARPEEIAVERYGALADRLAPRT